MGRGNRRPKGARKPKTVVTLLVQGKVTEPEYFDRMKQLRDWGKKAAIKMDRYPKDPKTMAERAERMVAQEDSDVVFIVFDWDDSPQSQVVEAVRITNKRANREKLYAAISYPKFDLWLCAHRRTMKQGCDSSKVTQIEKQLQILEPKGAQLRKHMPADFEYHDYKKAELNTNSVGFGEWDEQGSTAIPSLIRYLDSL